MFMEMQSHDSCDMIKGVKLCEHNRGFLVNGTINFAHFYRLRSRSDCSPVKGRRLGVT